MNVNLILSEVTVKYPKEIKAYQTSDNNLYYSRGEACAHERRLIVKKLLTEHLTNSLPERTTISSVVDELVEAISTPTFPIKYVEL